MENILIYNNNNIISIDNLIIGSGAGGSITAEYLSKKGKEVLIIEEGEFIRNSPEDCDITHAFPSLYREGGTIPVLSNCTFVFSEGCCVGGSTMVNSGLIHKIPVSLIEEWEEKYKIKNFTPEIISKYQNSIEKDLNVVNFKDSKNSGNNILIEGSKKLKYTGFDVKAAVSIRGKDIKKNNMLRTYLRKAFKNNVKIFPGCKAIKILVTKKKAKYIIAECKDLYNNKKIIKIFFNNLFICSGAIQTPLLLHRSGIKKNIGNTLQMHPTLRLLALFDKKMEAYYKLMPFYQIKEFAPDITLGASVSSPSLLAASLATDWDVNKKYLKEIHKMQSYYIAIRGSDRGKIRNLPFKNSYMVKYNINKQDIRNLSRGLYLFSDFLFKSGAKKLFPAINSLNEINKINDVKKYKEENISIKDLTLMTIHAFSSCPMGEDKKISAVDSYGKLHGYENIYINDASILPESPSVNPQGPLMAIALRNIEYNERSI